MKPLSEMSVKELCDAVFHDDIFPERGMNELARRLEEARREIKRLEDERDACSW
jgi:hypothetical protein